MIIADGRLFLFLEYAFVADSQSPSNAQVQIPAHFHYHDINTVSLEGLVPHLKLQTQLPLFQVRVVLVDLTFGDIITKAV